MAALSVYTCSTGDFRLAAAVYLALTRPIPYRTNLLLGYNTYQAFSGFDKIVGDKRLPVWLVHLLDRMIC